MEIDYMKIGEGQKIPVYSFGTKKRVLLFSGIHGDEDSGPIILKLLVTKLKKEKEIDGVTIIPVANLGAFRARKRTNPADEVDLNRIFPVKKIRSQSYRLGSVLQKYAERFEIVIDIHVFTKRQTLLCGIDLCTGNDSTRKTVRRLMNILNLDAICIINHKTEPQKYGSLCEYLQSLNKLAFGIELPPYRLLTKTRISNIIDGLMKISKCGINTETMEFKKIPSFIRQQYIAKEKGIFIPKNKLGEKISKGKLIGEFLTPAKKMIKIYSPYNGILLSISYKRPVKAGETIFTVGKPVK